MKKRATKKPLQRRENVKAKTLVELKARYSNTDTLYHISGRKSSKEGEKP